MIVVVRVQLKLKCDYPGLHTLPLCGPHYAALAPLLACALCRRRITKHHNVHFIHQVTAACTRSSSNIAPVPPPRL